MTNSAICIDASMLLRLVRAGGGRPRLQALWESWYLAKRPIIAPALLHYELVNALRRAVVHAALTEQEADETLQAAFHMPITLYGDAALHRRALALSHAWALPAAYDAHYLALAERLGADLWMADQRLYRVVGAALPWVHYFDEDAPDERAGADKEPK